MIRRVHVHHPERPADHGRRGLVYRQSARHVGREADPEQPVVPGVAVDAGAELDPSAFSHSTVCWVTSSPSSVKEATSREPIGHRSAARSPRPTTNQAPGPWGTGARDPRRAWGAARTRPGSPARCRARPARWRGCACRTRSTVPPRAGSAVITGRPFSMVFPAGNASWRHSPVHRRRFGRYQPVGPEPERGHVGDEHGEGDLGQRSVRPAPDPSASARTGSPEASRTSSHRVPSSGTSTVTRATPSRVRASPLNTDTVRRDDPPYPPGPGRRRRRGGPPS